MEQRERKIFMRKKFVLFAIAGMLLLGALAFTGASSPHAFAASEAATGHTTASVALACPPGLSEGSSGYWVGRLQGTLNSLYLNFNDPRYFYDSPDDFSPPLAVDRSFGPKTLHAVIDYQYWNPPLAVDGMVGPQTWHSLGYC
jgi:peptidoglycan hydrolase-like protein with peptidoglycan-binding domain